MEVNKAYTIYNSHAAVSGYRKKKGLFLEETYIHKIVSDRRQNNVMIDLGIGTGRTTPDFYPLFSKYYGIDIAPAMINACKEDFARYDRAEFITGDVAMLPVLLKCQADFIFFSGQGISFQESIEQMQELLNNIYKLLSAGGVFAFSNHNAMGIDSFYDFQIPKNPLNVLGEIKKCRSIRKSNGNKSKYVGKDYFRLNENTLLVKPSYMVGMLHAAGFNNVTIIDRKAQLLLDADKCKDNILHYICYK